MKAQQLSKAFLKLNYRFWTRPHPADQLMENSSSAETSLDPRTAHIGEQRRKIHDEGSDYTRINPDFKLIDKGEFSYSFRDEAAKAFEFNAINKIKSLKVGEAFTVKEADLEALYGKPQFASSFIEKLNELREYMGLSVLHYRSYNAIGVLRIV